MEFFISNAWAEGAAPVAPPPMWIELVPFIVMFAVVYLFMIRPQQKKQKEQKALLDSLAKGDEIICSGGLVGRIADLGDNFILLEISKGIQVKVQRAAVAMVLPKGTTKGL